MQNGISLSIIDIASEMNHWTANGKFKGSKIICPYEFSSGVGDPTSFTIERQGHGNFVYYIDSVKIKDSFIDVSLFGDEEKAERKYPETTKTRIEELLTLCSHRAMIDYLYSIMVSGRIKSLTISATSVKNIDFAAYDLCIAIPDFRQFNKFLNTLLESRASNLDFNYIILSPYMNRASACIGVPLMEHQAWLGYNRHFAVDYHENDVVKKVAVDWLTSYGDAQCNLLVSTTATKSTLYKKPIAMNNITMKDGTHPVRYSVDDGKIPENIWLFASSAILDTLPYHISDNRIEWYATGCKKYFNKEFPEKNPLAHKFTNNMLKYGKGEMSFPGIIFRLRRTD